MREADLAVMGNIDRRICFFLVAGTGAIGCVIGDMCHRVQVP